MFWSNTIDYMSSFPVAMVPEKKSHKQAGKQSRHAKSNYFKRKNVFLALWGSSSATYWCFNHLGNQDVLGN